MQNHLIVWLEGNPICAADSHGYLTISERLVQKKRRKRVLLHIGIKLALKLL